MLDSNTFYLNEYEIRQSNLETDWELTKPQKCEQVIEYAKKIMQGHVSNIEFDWVFSEFCNDGEFDTGDYVDGFTDALDKWNSGVVQSNVDSVGSFGTQEQIETIWSITKAALTGSSRILFDVELGELCEGSSAKMAKEVIYGN